MSDLVSSGDEPPVGAPRRRREPFFNTPRVVIASCAVLLIIQAVRGVLPVELDNRLVADLALMPARFALALDIEPARLAAAYQAASGNDPFAAQQIDFLVGDGGTRWWTLLTCALLHVNWSHVGFNCLWLVTFGTAVARRLPAGRWLVLFVLCVLGGNLVYLACNLTSFDIVIGASGGISGFVGAVTRFLFRPSAEPVDPTATFYGRPALTIGQFMRSRGALAFTAVFLVTNGLSGYFPSIGGFSNGPVAWQAHIGGFLTGLLLLPLFDRRRPAAEPES